LRGHRAGLCSLIAVPSSVELNADVVAIGALVDSEIAAMHALYASCYADTTAAAFERDLKDKTSVVLLRDAAGVIQGFSSLKTYWSQWRGERIRVIFSGDTLIAPDHWGSQRLALAWIRHAGQIQREAAPARVVWFLICKGHRTYRYLRAFALDYAPHCGRPASAATQALMQYLATERFGSDYDAEAGVLRFAVPQGRLAPELVAIPPAHLRMPEVEFFLRSNPGYARGDELVCLCELKQDNLRPLARRVFAGE